MKRGPGRSIAANPVLIGAATTLILIVAVFLAYNANNGLPFVPTYQVKAHLPNASNLVVGNDVRIGGQRVGVVSEIKPETDARTGTVTALITLKLQTSVDPLPRNSTVLVRPRSALGLKYVQITRGAKGSGGFADGDTIPLRNAIPTPVEIDQVFNTFNTPTRAASQVNLFEFGNALAGRGQDLNVAIRDLNPLLRLLVPVAKNLNDRRTQLRAFFPALARAASIVAPAAEAQASLFVNLDTTFSALASVARPYIQDAITGAAPAQEAATRQFPVIRPFLANSQHLFAELAPGVKALAPAARPLAVAFTVGTPTLRRLVAFNNRLKTTFTSLQRFAEDPLTLLGISDLNQTASTLKGPVNFLTPTQTVCNYVTLWFRNVAGLLSQGSSLGTWQRFIIITTPLGPNNEGGPSSAPANGPGADNHLHSNPYPNSAAPGQPQECEAANETYAPGQTVIGNVPGNQGANHEQTKRDPTS